MEKIIEPGYWAIRILRTQYREFHESLCGSNDGPEIIHVSNDYVFLRCWPSNEFKVFAKLKFDITE